MVEHGNVRAAAASSCNAVAGELPRSERTCFPLAFNQRDMWVQRQIHTSPALNNVCVEVTLEGPLRPDLFQQALQEVINRQGALRTVFLEQDGVPCQRLLDRVELRLPVTDLSEVDSPTERANTILDRQRELAGIPLNFTDGPLFNASLLRFSPGEHVFLFGFTHLVLDGIYMSQLFDQVGWVYERLLAGAPAALPPLDLQYAEFAASQNERWQLGHLAPHEAYWKKQLEVPLPEMALPTAKGARRSTNFELDVFQRQVPEHIFKALRSFRKRYRTTLFRVLLAAYEVLLHKVLNKDELLLGVPFSTLPSHAPELLGFFGHLVPVRPTIRGSQRFTDLLADVNRQLADAEANVDYPLCEAVRDVDIGRDPRYPLFPVIISQVKTLERHMGGVTMKMASRFVYGGVYDFWLTVMEAADDLSLGFYYNRGLLSGNPVKLLADCILELLSQVAANPEARVSDLSVIPKGETDRIVGFAQSDEARQEGPWPDELIALQAREHPQSVAVSDGRTQLTYAQLNSQADQIANWLRSEGATCEDKVGILGQREPGMLVAILGALKAGIAYVPLDPSDPVERLLGTVCDAKLKWLAVDLECSALGNELAHRSGCQVFHWDGPAGPWTQMADTALQKIDRCENELAYVFYTSGSTGKPKGAMVERAGMRNHLRAKINLLNLSATDVVAQNASHCFDISVWQFLAPLMVGAQVRIYNEDFVLNPQALAEAVQRDGVTVLEVVPSYLELLLTSVDVRRQLGRLRYLVSTAETLPVSVSQRWLELSGGIKLVNAWGPTECSDDVTHEVFDTIDDGTERIAVGRPIAGSRLYVLDQYLDLLPIGCVGQIAVGGVCVGRGYLDDPVKTAQTFVPDPYSCTAGSRLYLTGDIGRWRWDGHLEFLGRSDGQVKVRGQRVEVGEIEGVLSGHPQISQAVVETKKNRLVGYWVGRGTLEIDQLRRYLLQRVPEHMVPEAWVRLDKVPLNRNGKVDRRKLPEPDWNAGVNEYIGPKTELERQIADVWQEALGIEKVGRNDDFFRLGGQSLNATKVVLRLRNQIKGDLSVRDIFLNPTVARLAQALSCGPNQSCAAEAIPRLPKQHCYPLAPVQRPMWIAFGETLRDEQPGWGFPQFLRVAGNIDSTILNEALMALVQRHEVLRTSFIETDGEPGQTIHDSSDITAGFHDLSQVETACLQENLLGLVQRQLAVPLTNRPPMLRVQLVRLSMSNHLLIIQFPHIVSDLWTERILAEDLAELYTALHEGRTPLLPCLPLRYVDYANWYNQRLDSAEVQVQKDYWIQRFLNNIPPLEFGDNKSNLTIDSQALSLPQDLVIGLTTIAKNNGSTLFVVMLAALNVLLTRLTGSTDVAVGTPVSGRSRPEFERVVGLFLNPLALRCDLTGNPSFTDLIIRANDTVTAALTNQECPFHEWWQELRRRKGNKTTYPYSMVLLVEEAMQGISFGTAKASLESPPSLGLDLKNAAAPFLTLRVSENVDGWYAEIVPGFISNIRLPAAFLQLFVQVLHQVVQAPETRVTEFSLKMADKQQAPRPIKTEIKTQNTFGTTIRSFDTVELDEEELSELLN